MKKEKKTITLVKSKKITFFIYLISTAAIGYLLAVNLFDLAANDVFRYMVYAVTAAVFLLLVAAFIISMTYKTENQDEMAQYDLARVHNKMSNTLPIVLCVIMVLCLFIRKDFTMVIDKWSLVLLAVFQVTLLLTVEQGIFLSILKKENAQEDEDD